MMRILAAWSVCFATSLANIWACSCSPSPPPLRALEYADAVFFGKVEQISEKMVPIDPQNPSSRLFPELQVKFTIQKTFKGQFNDRITVTTNKYGAACGFPFKDGKCYLVYAYKTDGPEFEVSLCSRTAQTTIDCREIQELEHRLPPPMGEEKEPVLSLKGSLNEKDDRGYVFVLQNRLHHRIFTFGQFDSFLAQVLVDGKWMDCAANYDDAPPSLEDPPLTTKENLARWKNDYNEQESDSAGYINAGASQSLFAAAPSANHTWRIGLQYLSEKDFYAGKKIQKSKTIIWSDPIVPGQKAPPLTSDQAHQSDE